MKKLITLFAFLLISVMAFAQNPKLSYQAVVRDSQNKLVVEQPVTVTVNVLKVDNTSQFEQTLHATTNRNGLMSLEIGDETATWSNIDWEGAKIRTAVTLSNGNQVIDTSNVNAVPLALQTIRPAGVIIPQSDWAETDNGKNTFILNKPSIADTVNNILTNGQYVTTSGMNARISDTLSQYTKTTGLCNVVNNCDLSSNASIANLSTLLQGLSNQMENMNEKMDSLNHLVDSLSSQIPTPVYPSFTCGHYTVKDHEGNVYNTVRIGEQCWTKENMRCTTSPSTGTVILEHPASSYSYTGKKAYYPDSIAYNVTDYGLLYNWCATIDTFNTTYEETSTNTDFDQALSVTFTGNHRGICPQGWHVPSEAEWKQLREYMVSHSQYWCNGDSTHIAKALASSTGWSANSNDCGVGNTQNNNNTSGFTALPAGFYTNGFFNFGYHAHFWSATQSNASSAFLFQIDYHHPNVQYENSGKDKGASVRCLRDGGISDNTGDNEKQSSTTSMTCEDVMNCMGDTLGKLNEKINNLSNVVDGQNTIVLEQNKRIDSLTNVVDSLFNLIPFTCGESKLRDIDGNEYSTILINGQCWMAENLRVTHRPNGQPLVNGTDSTNRENKRFYYKPAGIITEMTPEQYVATYGLLYSYTAAVDSVVTNLNFPNSNCRGICPQGWHIPTYNEFTTISSYTDIIEIFNPSLAGYFNSDQNKFKSVSENALYWSATPESETQANAWKGSRYDRKYGLSVRCLKD